MLPPHPRPVASAHCSIARDGVHADPVSLTMRLKSANASPRIPSFSQALIAELPLAMLLKNRNATPQHPTLFASADCRFANEVSRTVPLDRHAGQEWQCLLSHLTRGKSTDCSRERDGI